MMRLRAFVAVASVLAASVAAAAQTPPASGGGTVGGQVQEPSGRAGQPAPGQRAGGQPVNPLVAIRDVEDALDGRVLIQAQTALQLSDAQYQAFWPKMRELQKVRRQHEQRHVALINQLNQATKAGAPLLDDATLTARVKALDDLEAAMVSDERAALAEVDSVLTVFQRARFRVFEENMEREKLKLLVKVLATPGG
jgi:hypothetical protein